MINDLKVVRRLKETERFVSYQAEFSGQKVFAKQAKSDNTNLHLSFQVKNSQTVDDIGGQLFRAPKILIQENDWIITEWLDGQSLEAQVQATPDQVALALAEVVGVFDAQPDSDTVIRPVFTFEGLRDRINDRIHSAVRQRSEKLFADSLEAFRTYSSKLQPCLQDADVQPEHLFADPQHEAEFVLVDSEHLNTHWPRYYDLANNYSKYWKRNNRDFSKCLLKKYLELNASKTADMFESFAASLIVRAFALHWENDYDPGALDTNIPRSQELLSLVINASQINDLT